MGETRQRDIYAISRASELRMSKSLLSVPLMILMVKLYWPTPKDSGIAGDPDAKHNHLEPCSHADMLPIHATMA